MSTSDRWRCQPAGVCREILTGKFRIIARELRCWSWRGCAIGTWILKWRRTAPVKKAGIVTSWITVVISSAGGVIVTLLGAVTGGAIASRSQKRHWTRDKQVDACAVVVSESTRAQLAMRRLWRHGEKVDWTAWNQALAMISLVGTPATIARARGMDEAFWRCTERIKELGNFDERYWEEILDDLESVRLEFINEARQQVVRVGSRLDKLPIVRPPIALTTDDTFASAAPNEMSTQE